MFKVGQLEATFQHHSYPKLTVLPVCEYLYIILYFYNTVKAFKLVIYTVSILKVQFKINMLTIYLSFLIC